MKHFNKSVLVAVLVLAMTLGIAGSVGVTAATPKFVIGGRVAAAVSGVYARATASSTGKILQLHKRGELGTVVGGPQVANGTVWWNINYDTGLDGWSRERSLNKYIPIVKSVAAPAPAPAPATNLTNTRGLATSLPDTGFSDINIGPPWNVILPTAIIIVLLLLYFARKPRKSRR